jgi:hypothetical protein
VRVLDVHLPLSEKNRTPTSSSVQVQPFVIARIAYPSQEDSTNAPSSSSSFPFLPVSVAEQYCNLFMQKGGAPPLIKAMTFLLHHWRLIRIHRVSSSSSSDLSSSSQSSSDRKPIMKFWIRGYESSAAILCLINEERKGDIIDTTLVKKTVALYEAMGITSLEAYVEDMETPLLDATRSFYALKSQEWIVTDSTPEYLIKAEHALEEEKVRVGEYLHPCSESKLLRVCLEELLEKVEMVLLEKEGSGFMALLANEKSEDLIRMFALFSRVENGLNPMANMVEQFIVSMGNEVIKQRQARIEGGDKDKNDDPDFIKALLELHEKYLALIRSDFSGHIWVLGLKLEESRVKGEKELSRTTYSIC